MTKKEVASSFIATKITEENQKKLLKRGSKLKIVFTFAPTNKAGALAQLVEQRTENPCVPGSIPGGTTKKTSIEILRFFCFGLFF